MTPQLETVGMQAPFTHAWAQDIFGPRNLPPSAWHADGVMFSRQFPATSQLPLDMQHVPRGAAQSGPAQPESHRQEPWLLQTPFPEHVVPAWQNVQVG